MRSASSSASSSACEMKTIETPRFLRSRTRSKKYFFSSGVRRRGRLVEDDDLGLVQHRARDLDHLLLGGAERADGRGRGDVEIQRLQELLRGDVDAAQAIVEVLLAEKEVLRHRHRRHEAVLLEHHGDAEMARLQRRTSAATSTPSTVIVPEVRVTTPAMTLVSVDLPAPFSPTSAWISPRLQVEIDALDRRNAGVEFGRVVQREDDVAAHAPTSLSSGAMGSFRIRPGPLAIMIRTPPTFDGGDDAVVDAVDAAVQRIERRRRRRRGG